MTARDDHLLTRVVHAGSPPFDQGAAPVNVPVVRTSTVRFASDADRVELSHRREAGEPVSTYGRHGMATHRALEAAIAELEGADEVLLAPSGLSAVSLVFIALLSPGDHVLVQDSVYGPVRERVEPLLTRLGVSVSYFSAGDGVPTASVRPNTRLIYAESPSSFLYEVVDLPALAAFAREHRIVLAADNTWGAGLLYRPLALGADISVQAITKYLGGHSDLMQGAVSTANPALASKLRAAHDALGLSVSADDAYLALRGIRTLAVRLAQHGRNAFEVAQYLQSERNAISRVFHPALPDDPGHTLWRRDFTGANGLVSFALRNADQSKARAFVDALRLFGIGASWGGYESLTLVAPLSRVREHSYWRGDEPVVRLHIGLEDPADLIADLRQAFHRVHQ
ncbi:cystathionine beta-lyase [Paraburkholderia caribensis]|uniref:Cystathionine beta-lyase n=1 Tax=Paraburkholderia caribensis TaxID=75105 RepID=A0A9Q6S9E1_9BURK|nr:cystathionine beta-lyase [Paraburkholderia caribensis]MCO4880163.1 cystathionine beta-lyase [Paraburkholderia caribensis]PTB26615.1 cystathionine beta-lyase [Paraburkholderia caribensis]QLB66776.1 cystathionine beta-lyase [Paraburkholderia caribensis]